MQYRECVIFTGMKLIVPEHIQRIDKTSSKGGGATHGWQVRYGEWKFFADHTSDGSGAEASLAEATNELLVRIHSIEAPTGLRKNISATKMSDLPAGISGPLSRIRKGRRTRELSFGVTIPRFGQSPTNRNVYIGTENTVTDARIDLALAKAIEIRNKAECAYQEAATKAKRSFVPRAPE